MSSQRNNVSFPTAVERLLRGCAIQRESMCAYDTAYVLAPDGDLLLVGGAKGGAAVETFDGADIAATDWCVVVRDPITSAWKPVPRRTRGGSAPGGVCGVAAGA